MSSKAYTLFELLVVSLIVVVLMGVVLPVLAGARIKAMDVDDMARLHQVSLAAAMYAEDNEVWPTSTGQLVVSGLAPTAICALRGDSSEEGLANILATARELFPYDNRELKLPFKASIVGLREARADSDVFFRFAPTLPGAGWAVDVTPGDLGRSKAFTDAEGKYRRLVYDGSVSSKKHRDQDCSTEVGTVPCRSNLDLFLDPGTGGAPWIE